jgi:hypothetical protein
MAGKKKTTKKKFTKTQVQSTFKSAVQKYKKQNGNKKLATFIKDEFAKKRKELKIPKK